MFYGFQRATSHTQGNLVNGLDLIEYNMCCQITFMLLVTVEKFETNPVLVNVNKFKPHKKMESKVPKKMNKCQYIGNRM